jgi:hypothetical protein
VHAALAADPSAAAPPSRSEGPAGELDPCADADGDPPPPGPPAVVGSMLAIDPAPEPESPWLQAAIASVEASAERTTDTSWERMPKR